MGLDSLPDHIKTKQQAIDYFAKMDGVTDHEFIEHEPVSAGSNTWTKTLWTVNKGAILCHLLYEPDNEDPDRWYYQVYAEHAGPCMINAPLRMLEAVPCPRDKWAIEWRHSVLEYHRIPGPGWPKYMNGGPDVGKVISGARGFFFDQSVDQGVEYTLTDNEGKKK